MKIGSLSLKWRIVLFYVMFGFMPLLTISFISYNTAAESIGTLTDQQLTQLMERISQQTVSSFEKAQDDIIQLSQNPIIQLSFLQFSYGQRMETLKERLSVYRTSTHSLDGIALFTEKGEVVLESPAGEDSVMSAYLDKDTLTEAYKNNFSIRQDMTDNKQQIYLFKRVYDYEDETVPLGLLVFAVPLSVFADFVEQVEIADGLIKEIRNSDGELIYELREESSGRQYDVYREFSTNVDPLGWKINIKIPEKALLKDIISLRNTSFIFALVIGSVAFIAAMMFVERILTPVRQIIKGTNRFSKGDLDYRINMTYGKEIRMLADSFDNMAENLQKRQTELVQANKLASLGLMSAGIAHEIKNPLAAIKTSIQVMKRRVRTEASQQLSDGILQEVDRLNKIISDLLNFSKPGPANISEYDLKTITDYCVQLMNKDIRDKNVQIINNTVPCRVMVDPAQMQQIIINLLLNSLSAVKSESGVIELSIRTDNELDTAVFEIKDNGRGISEDKLDKIFDPFFSMTSGGTGLGLSVVFTLLKQNNIEHIIESRENEGTVFRLIFRKRGESGKDSNS